MIDDKLMWTIIGSLVGLVLIAIAASIYQAYQHEKFLSEHGCELLTEAPTGRQVYCGKACFRPEKVYVYECADGTRTEVR